MTDEIIKEMMTLFSATNLVFIVPYVIVELYLKFKGDNRLKFMSVLIINSICIFLYVMVFWIAYQLPSVEKIIASCIIPIQIIKCVREIVSEWIDRRQKNRDGSSN